MQLRLHKVLLLRGRSMLQLHLLCLCFEQLSPQCRVPAVLDRIVGPAGQHLRYLRPPVTELTVHLDDYAVLLHRPGVFVDAGAQVMAPTLATLLRNAIR